MKWIKFILVSEIKIKLDFGNNMDFDIYQEQTAVVRESGIEYLVVKRKQRWRLISEFYRNNVLVLKATRSCIGPDSIRIEFQNLPNEIFIEKSGSKFYLNFDQQQLFIKIRYFKIPHFIFYLNDIEVGFAKAPKFITVGYQAYKISTTIENEDVNLYYLILFLLQVKPL